MSAVEELTPGAVADAAITLEHVSRRFTLLPDEVDAPRTLAQRLSSWPTRRRGRSFWAVRDVSMEIRRGEFFSIVGANGSGKSTLLRLMAGLSKPTEGRVRTVGRLSTLLELGAGFHPNVSGRENAIINGLLIGMTRSEIIALLPSIIEFSGLQEFIDEPMRTYSSGMYVRLGFAIAAHMEPELLLVDEVLAVGDAKFQEKCFGFIEGLRERGVTIVMVSHDLGAVERFSTRAALMEHGRIIEEGDAAMVVAQHRSRLDATSAEIHGGNDDDPRAAW